MNKDRGFNYYDAYLKQVDYANELACNLESAIVTGDFGSRELVDALHTIENDADEVCHEVHAHLLTDFVVPFERGSMAALANAIDDISDTIEDVTIQAYYYHCSGIEPAGRETVSLVVLAIQSLRSAILLLGSLPTHDGKLKGHLLVCKTEKANATVSTSMPFTNSMGERMSMLSSAGSRMQSCPPSKKSQTPSKRPQKNLRLS